MTDQELDGGKKNFDYFWRQIESAFDFEKVEKVMEFLNWGWFRGDWPDGEISIPDKERIIDHVKTLCKKAYDNEYDNRISAGGFTVSFDNEGLHVEFILENWTAE